MIRRIVVLLLAAGGILLAPPLASAAVDRSVRDEASREGWPFRQGRVEVGLQAGGGISLQRDPRDGPAFALLPRVGYTAYEFATGLPGSLAVAAQPLYLTVSQDRTAHVGGVAALLKYNIRTPTRFTPFVEVGGGATYASTPTASLGSRFNFVLQAGGGVQYALSDRYALSAEWLYQHLSNAKLYERDPGLNLGLLLLGFSALY